MAGRVERERAPAIILLANVGNRDLQVDGQELGEAEVPVPADERPTLRAKAKAILAAYETYRNRLSAPIIAPCVEYYLDLHAPSAGIEQVVLFGTDQPLSVGNYHYGNDTIWSARVLERWLRERFRLKEQPVTGRWSGIRAVGVVPVAVEGVHRYDLMYDFFGRALADPGLHRTEPTRHVVSMSGGTPAANASLLLRALDYFGGVVEAVHQSGAGRRPTLLRIGQQIRRQALRAPVVSLLEQGNFAGAAAVLEAWDDPGARLLAAGARGLQRWLDFDVDGARRVVRQALHDPGQQAPRAVVEAVDQLLNVLAGRGTSTAANLSDLFWNADLCRKQDHLVDFVARAARLVEAVPAWVAETALGVSIGRNRDEERKRFWDAVEERSLDVARSRSNAPEQDRSIDTAVLLEVMDGLAKKGTIVDGIPFDALRRAAILARALLAVRQPRNLSIVGHDFVGVADHEIADVLLNELEKRRQSVEKAVRRAQHEARATAKQTGECADGDGLAVAQAELQYVTLLVTRAGESVQTAGGAATVLGLLNELLTALGAQPETSSPFMTWGQRLAAVARVVDTEHR